MQSQAKPAPPDVHSLIIIAGKPQHGKTFYTEKILSQKMNNSGGWTFVYNVGRVTDWEDAKTARPVHPSEIAERKGITKSAEIKDFVSRQRTIDAWEIEGKFYRSQDLPKIFAGETLKCYCDLELQSRIHSTMFKYFYGGLIVLDDNRGVGKRTPQLLTLYSRSNHCGQAFTKKAGMNLAVVYHSLDYVTEELYTYATHMVLFKLNSKPRIKLRQDLEEEISKAFEALSDAPMYSRCEIFLNLPDIVSRLKIHNA